VKDITISGLLASLGLRGEAAALGRAALEDARLTNARKHRMSLDKVATARKAIDEELARLCRRCAADAADEARIVVVVDAAACTRCGGSANVRALDDLAAAAEAARISRLVLVGGSPDVRREFGRLHGRLELRLVDGTANRRKPEAQGDIAWADVVVVAGASELAHRVSELYTRDPAARGKLVVSSRRGVEAIAGEIVRHLERRLT
jgi:hypothetical protein